MSAISLKDNHVKTVATDALDPCVDRASAEKELSQCRLTHWGRVTHLCVSKLTSIASDNGLSPGRRQAIIWNNAGILLIGPLGTNFGEILIEIQTFSLKKIRSKVSSAKCRRFCLGLNVLNRSVSFMRKDFNFLLHISVKKWSKMQLYLYYIKYIQHIRG